MGTRCAAAQRVTAEHTGPPPAVRGRKSGRPAPPPLTCGSPRPPGGDGRRRRAGRGPNSRLAGVGGDHGAPARVRVQGANNGADLGGRQALPQRVSALLLGGDSERSHRRRRSNEDCRARTAPAEASAESKACSAAKCWRSVLRDSVWGQQQEPENSEC